MVLDCALSSAGPRPLLVSGQVFPLHVWVFGFYFCLPPLPSAHPLPAPTSWNIPSSLWLLPQSSLLLFSLPTKFQLERPLPRVPRAHHSTANSLWAACLPFSSLTVLLCTSPALSSASCTTPRALLPPLKFLPAPRHLLFSSFSDVCQNHKSAWRLLINLDVANMSVCLDSSPVTRPEILCVTQITWSTATSALCTKEGKACLTEALARYVVWLPNPRVSS